MAYFIHLMLGLVCFQLALIPLGKANTSHIQLDEKASWPAFRANLKNQGYSAQPARYVGDQPWFFKTEKGIFSTAVIDRHQNIYAGSADKNFYVLSPEGQLLWTLQTGEIIDSAAVLTTDQKNLYVTVPSGDGHIYHLNASANNLEGLDRIQWKFSAHDHPHSQGVGYPWFEGNVAIDQNATFYAGNTNWNFYAIDAHTGNLKWVYPSNNMNWSAPSFDDQGHLYWTSLDQSVRKMDAITGKVIWSRRTLGFNSSSVALDFEGRAFTASFDGSLYAYDQETGQRLWSIKTQDHIYASPALSFTPDKRLKAIYITSTDGQLYKVNPSGKVDWQFDTQAVIRSSPVINSTENGQDIIYFGAGNGLLYAINEDGALRWAFDTNSHDPYLKDRNDLNASPALSKNGLIINGEHGYLWYIPYDYPLHHPDDPRSVISIDSQADGVHLSIKSGGWEDLGKRRLNPSSMINLSFAYYENGNKQKAGLNTWLHASNISIDPPTPFTWEISGSAQEIYIRPQTMLQPNHNYTIRINGSTISHGLKVGMTELGGSKFIPFQAEVEFTTGGFTPSTVNWKPNDDEILAFDFYRLAFASPPIITSLNQIGFDSLQWKLVIIDSQANSEDPDRGRLLAWLVESDTTPHGDSPLSIPLSGEYWGSHYILKGQDMTLDMAGIKVSVDEIDIRGQLNSDLVADSNSTIYVRIKPSIDFNYGPSFALSGILNSNFRVPLSGTYLLHPSDHGPAHLRPPGVTAEITHYIPPSWLRHGELHVAIDSSEVMPGGRHMELFLFDLEAFKPLGLIKLHELQDSGSSLSARVSLPKTWNKSKRIGAYLMYRLYPIWLGELTASKVLFEP
ncbi:MAG: PQQ-binding-like beta-propeller repeat protein [Oligoflexus sp.]